MNKTKNDLSENTRGEVISVIQSRVADGIDLHSQTKQAHWNVRGKNFIALHELFDQIATEVLGHVDLMAERITALGGRADGTVRIAAGASTLPEYPINAAKQGAHVAAVSDALAFFGKSIRADIRVAEEAGDVATADLFTEISRATDKNLWLVEAHME